MSLIPILKAIEVILIAHFVYGFYQLMSHKIRKAKRRENAKNQEENRRIQ